MPYLIETTEPSMNYTIVLYFILSDAIGQPQQVNGMRVTAPSNSQEAPQNWGAPGNAVPRWAGACPAGENAHQSMPARSLFEFLWVLIILKAVKAIVSKKIHMKLIVAGS